MEEGGKDEEWQETVNRIKGMLFGGALGDAVGLPAEGSDPITVADKYPDGVDYPYKGSYRGYPSNDWTDATDTTVVVMRAMVAFYTNQGSKGQSPPGSKVQSPYEDFAARLVSWYKSGFQELGDAGGVQPEGVTLRAVTAPGFVRDPVTTAMNVRGAKTDNGALIRVAPCVLTDCPHVWGRIVCETTHPDERSVAAVTAYIMLLQTLVTFPTDVPVPAMLAVAPVAAGRECFANPGQRADYMARLTDTADIGQIGLGERDNRSHVNKTLAVALWACRQLARTLPAARDNEFYKKVIRAVAAEGGDASANCAVAGTVLGAMMGASGLPRDWLEALPNRDWLDAEIDKYVEKCVV